MSQQVMLAGKVSDVNNLHYPVLASMKLDGIRAFVHRGKLMSRKFKLIPNRYVQELFGGLPGGLDGELIYGEPTAPDCMRVTTSAVMSDDHETGKDVVFHVFDCIPQPVGPTDFYMGTRYTTQPGFQCRFHSIHARLTKILGESEGTSWVGGKRIGAHSWGQVHLVNQMVIQTPEQLLDLEATALAAGYEGLMVRDPDGPYKHGRSTEREGILLKLKRFEDSEALVIGYEELLHNSNEATKDELGHTKRSTAKDGKVGLGTFGKFLARDCKTGVEFDCGTGKGLTKALRAELWTTRDTLIGRIIKYKFFPSGGKDKPRFPIWLGWRDPRDMDQGGQTC
jgi:DNA ligase-1